MTVFDITDNLLVECPLWWRGFMYTYRLRGEEQINQVLPGYGGVYNDGIIVFENDQDATAFILKYSFETDPVSLEDY